MSHSITLIHKFSLHYELTPSHSHTPSQSKPSHTAKLYTHTYKRAHWNSQVMLARNNLSKIRKVLLYKCCEYYLGTRLIDSIKYGTFSPLKQILHVGSHAMFLCYRSLSDLIWLKNNKPIRSKRAVISGQSLTIINLKYHDSGRYSCKGLTYEASGQLFVAG